MRKHYRWLLLLISLLLCLSACQQSSQQSEPVHLELVTEGEQAQSSQDTVPEQEEAAPEQAAPTQAPQSTERPEGQTEELPESGEYTSKADVARYLYLYGHLPGNFITKREAKALGWVSSEGNLGKVAPGKSIGGDRFGNYEGNLPQAEGRTYRECDIDADGGYRGAKRIVWSNDGLIYYTEDHYQHFELLYGEE